MLSSNESQLKIILGDTKEEKIQFLTNIINNQAANQDKKNKSLQLRVGINYELKRWQDVINDINTLQQTINTAELQVMKSKATIQECCRKERISIMDMVHNGEHTDEIELHFFNISQRSVDDFIEGQSVTKGRGSTATTNKRQKKFT
ncbi:hypothetical protein I4U23_018287 [Adineta vaga]|nr:hypothetical protein I4U23_018287 [Adineta vaga]